MDISTVGIIASLLVSVTTLATLLVKFGEFKERVNHFAEEFKKIDSKFDKIDGKFDKIDGKFDKIDGKFDRIDAELKQLRNDLADLKVNVANIGAIVGTHDNILQKKYTSYDPSNCKNSPRRLTKMGQQILADSNGRKFLEDNKKMLFERMEMGLMKSRYDVEQNAYKAILSIMNDDVFIPIKDFIYESSLYTTDDGDKTEVDMSMMCNVLAIELRDLYLKEVFEPKQTQRPTPLRMG